MSEKIEQMKWKDRENWNGCLCDICYLTDNICKAMSIKA